MNYYIADMHFGHENIIKHSKRPFHNANEMDRIMINNWNEVVQNDDNVYILGDICFKNAGKPSDYLEQLKGNKFIILGNHDTEIRAHRHDLNRFPGCVWIKDYAEIKDNGRKIILSHYPMVEWNGYYQGAIHLYGHVHNNTQNPAFEILKGLPNAYNVGVDILNYVPRTLDQVIQYNKNFNNCH